VSLDGVSKLEPDMAKSVSQDVTLHQRHSAPRSHKASRPKAVRGS